MDYMFQVGFLGTRAPLFMDFVVIIVALLPLLTAISIWFAKDKRYKLHKITQTTIFLVSLVVVGYFEYGMRLGGGYKVFIEGSSVSHNYAFYVLIFHIFISVVTLSIWSHTLYRARYDSRYKTLPGMNSISHKRAGIRTFIGILLTAVTGVWVYLLLFVF